MKKIIPLVMLTLVCFACCKSTKKATSEDMPLQNTKWMLISLFQEGIPDKLPAQPFIIFDEESNFSGNLGCNDFMGTYYQHKQKLTLSYTGSTRKLCENMETERAMLKALKSDIDNFSISGPTLILLQGNQEIMRFEASKE